MDAFEDTEFKCRPQEHYLLTGWLEFVCRTVATLVGIGSTVIAFIFEGSIRIDLFRSAQTWDALRIILISALGLATLVSIVVIIFSIASGELFTIGFAIASTIGHGFLILTAIIALSPGEYVFLFTFLNFLADVVHVMWTNLPDHEDFIEDVVGCGKSAETYLHGFLGFLHFVGAVVQFLMFLFSFQGNTSI
eukprot:TRINITY_DN752_c0_g1_i2.p1 TRINITY_DN752_c0_g1~~TRINITY_DN752_c0_g1_i2.p1  ORF type:complete len:192 (-),score=29.39 TRINITY_DN752_c0_g1_i2:35-610(-)